MKKYVRRGKRAYNRRSNNTTVPSVRQVKKSSLKTFVKKQIKKMVPKPELKVLPTIGAPTAFSCGQVNVNAAGYYSKTISSDVFQIASSANANGRVGNRIKCIGIQSEFFVLQQSASTVAQKYRAEIWFIKNDITTSATTLVTMLYRPNSISGVVDYNSTRAPEYKSEFQLVARKRFTLTADPYGTGVATYKNIKMFGKQRRILNWASSGASNPVDGQYIFVLLADAGNVSTGTASTLSSIPQVQVNTGCTGVLNTNAWCVEV